MLLSFGSWDKCFSKSSPNILKNFLGRFNLILNTDGFGQGDSTWDMRVVEIGLNLRPYSPFHEVVNRSPPLTIESVTGFGEEIWDLIHNPIPVEMVSKSTGSIHKLLD